MMRIKGPIFRLKEIHNIEQCQSSDHNFKKNEMYKIEIIYKVHYSTLYLEREERRESHEGLAEHNRRKKKRGTSPG